jgi:hypothetical protein
VSGAGLSMTRVSILGLPFSLVCRSVTMGGLTSTICFIGIGSLVLT